MQCVMQTNCNIRHTYSSSNTLLSTQCPVKRLLMCAAHNSCSQVYICACYVISNALAQCHTNQCAHTLKGRMETSRSTCEQTIILVVFFSCTRPLSNVHGVFPLMLLLHILFSTEPVVPMCTKIVINCR